jgi:hypothetical protein
MWAAWVIAAIAWAGAAFMIRFLIALLCEGAPSLCRLPPIPCSTSNLSPYHLKLLEKEKYAKEECSTGLIALDVRVVFDSSVWRAIPPRRGSIVREQRL